MHWLNQHVHRYAAIYDMLTLIEKSMGEALNAEYFIRHLHTRYTKD